MLDPDGRTLIVDILQPPPGTQLTHAIATTFTLDVEAALTAPLAILAGHIRDSDESLTLLNSLQRMGDRLDVFYQAGEISPPGQVSQLLTFLEPSLHPVHLGLDHLLHAKTWLLTFAGDKSTHLRFACLSRNLTSDRTWDLAVRLDGWVDSRPHAFNRPLSDFVDAVSTMPQHRLSAQRRRRLSTMSQNLRYADWDVPDPAQEIVFHFLDADRRNRTTLDLGGSRRTLVISPFCTDNGLRLAVPDDIPLTVVSRPEALDALSPETATRITEAYVVNDAATADLDAEVAVTRSVERRSGLHAKAYVVERGWRAHLFVGSANATDAGLRRNVEFVVELIGSRAKMGIDRIVGPESALRTVLDEYEPGGGPDPNDDDELQALEGELLRLAGMQFTARVERDGEHYAETVTPPANLALPEGVDGTMWLVNLPAGRRQLAGEPLVFTGLDLTDVTPFLIIELRRGDNVAAARLLQVDLQGDDPEARRDAVVANVIRTPEDFIRFIRLLLTLAGDTLPPGAIREILTKQDSMWGTDDAPLFERLVWALGHHPDALDDVEDTVRRLSRTPRAREVIPDSFHAIWTVIDQARHRKGAGTHASVQR